MCVVPGWLAVGHWAVSEVCVGEGGGRTAGPQPVRGREVEVHIGLLGREGELGAMT